MRESGQDTPLIISTRLGLGVSRGAYFDYRLSLLENTLAKSIKAQTDMQNVAWVISVDIRAPKDIEQRIESRISPAKAIVLRKNPLFTGLAPISAKDIKAHFDADDVIISRVDDDDFLHRDFVKNTRTFFSAFPGTPCAVSFASGIDFYLGRVQATARDHPWIGAGLSVRTTREDLLSPYDVTHHQVGKAALEKGGTAHVETGAPMWLRLWHAMSDSSEARGIRAADGPTLEVDWSHWGTTEADIRALKAFCDRPEHSNPGARSHRFGRITMKARILRQVKILRRKGKKAQTSSARKEYMRDARILLEVMYDV